jgi:outer membrane lipoprotein LolB
MFPRILACVLISVGLLHVSGCSQYSITKTPVSKPPVTVASKILNWKKRQNYMASKTSWNLQSKISLRYKDENLIFGLKWLQRPANLYVMQISNPLTGALVAKLSRDAKGVSLLADNGRTYRDSDEERLLQNRSGLKLPVKGMQYWVRGITAPQYKIDKLILDDVGRPQSLYQAGWKVSYSRYLGNNYNAAPRNIVLTRSKDKIYLKVIAKNWQGI